MRRCAAQRRYLSAIPTRSATDCAESRNTPADPSRGLGMSPNYVWRSKYTAALSSRNPLTLWTSGEPPRGRGSVPHAGGSRHQLRCGAEIPATSGRHRSPQRRQAPVVGRWVEPVESTNDFYRRNERGRIMTRGNSVPTVTLGDELSVSAIG